MNTVETSAPLIWDFVLSYYRQQGVSEAAIALQDTLGLDVNMVLFLMWLSRQKRTLSAADIKAVGEKSRPWQHSVVVPIRAIRRLLKENAPLVETETALAYRKKIQALEIEGEQLQLNAMADLSGKLTTSSAASAENAARENLKGLETALSQKFPQGAIDTFVAALKGVTDGK
jgi:uncharacterized protein (TIGR02444 family)